MAFVNPFDLAQNDIFSNPVSSDDGFSFDVGQFGRFGTRIPQFLTTAQVDYLYAQGLRHSTQPVGNDGIVAHYDPSNPYVGSYRASAYAVWFADFLFSRLPQRQKSDVLVAEDDGLDAPIGSRWRAIGINPLMRFIYYPKQTGNLIAHYDAPYIANERERTLKTFLLYLTTNSEGATRFMLDPQMKVEKSHRDWSDWDRNASLEEVVYRSPTQAGDMVMFEHRVLHDSEPVVSEQKMVIRTDITYQRID